MDGSNAEKPATAVTVNGLRKLERFGDAFDILDSAKRQVSQQKSDGADVLVAVIRKNAREEFRVALRTFKGQRLVDIRVYASNGVDVVPTAKGVAIKSTLLRAIIEALENAEQLAKAEGLL